MIKKIGLIALGTLSLIVGIIGIFLPILPTTPLLLLTSYCYIKSSERLSLLLLFMFIIIESPIMRCVIVIMWVTKVIFFTKMKTIKIEEV